MLNREEEWLLKEKYGGEKSEAFFTACQKLANGVPLAYLIGYIPFLNTKIYLDSHPLIPRPETEFWVEKVLAVIYQRAAPINVLDLCAGSGCIGVAVAKNYLLTQVDFVEIENKHIPTIETNCRENQIPKDRYQIFLSDLFANVPNKKYDFILSNPPYIDAALGRTETTVKDHEPALALYGGKAGMELLAKIISQAPQYLNPNGQLWLEHEPEQTEEITALAQPHFLTTTHKDQYQVLRFSQLVLK